MDADLFDRFARIVACTGSRRAAVGGILVGLAAGLPSIVPEIGTVAKGKKKCRGGKRRCGGKCKNLQTDRANCGRCDKVCPAGARCQSGVCVCPEGEVDCLGVCTNLLTDPDNCGTCGNDCVGVSCFHGACSCTAENECPDACTCGAREEGSAACFFSVSQTLCDVDGECPPGAVCLVNNRCSTPCVE